MTNAGLHFLEEGLKNMPEKAESCKEIFPLALKVS
jgi:hypothetical protein